MKIRIRIIFGAIIVVLICAVGYLKMDRPDSALEAIAGVNNSVKEIIHIEDLEEKTLVFYVTEAPNEGLSVGLLDHNWLGYKYIFGGGVAALDGASADGFSAHFTNLTREEDDEFILVSGVIFNEKINKVTVNDRTAKIITQGSYRIFYASLDDVEETHNTIIIKGYNDEGEVLIERGI